MKLKIALFTLISLPLWASEPSTILPTYSLIEIKYPMPNQATILALLNSNNEGPTFTNPGHNQAIAAALADQPKSKKDILECFVKTTRSAQAVEMSLKADHLLDGARFALNNPNFRQEYISPK